MRNEIRTRLAVLFGLLLLGLLLAGAGTAIGMTATFANPDSTPEFVVTDENVSVSTGDRTETVVRNMSNVRSVTINETTSGHFRVDTEEERPLTETERQRAREIAVDDPTVQRELDTLGRYEIAVDPIQKIESSRFSSDRYNTTVNVDGGDDGEFAITTWNTTRESGDGTVHVARDPTYVRDAAVVRIRRPGEPEHPGLEYTIRVDLSNETVTDVTDWDEIRQNEPTFDGSDVRNDSESAAKPP